MDIARQFTVDWFTHHIPTWEEWLKGYVGKPDVRALEIGSLEGRSAIWLLDNVLTGEGSELVCCDPWQEKRRWVEDSMETIEHRFDENLRPFADRVTKLKACSLEGLSRLYGAGSKFDIVYIDGDHYGPSVLTDGVLAFQLLHVGGILIFDDYHWQVSGIGVFPQDAIDAFCRVFRQEIRTAHSPSGQVACWRLR
jgi:predicted O-methyltransferase YrrM